MTWFDGIVIAALSLSTLFAFARGLTREMISLLVLAVGFIAAIYLSQPIGALVGANNSTFTKLLLFLVIFAIIFIMTLLVVEGLRHKFMGGKIGLIDHILGGLFGLVRGFVLIGGLYLIINYYAADGNTPDGFKNAATLPIAKASADMLENIGFETLPGDYQPDKQPST